ncbi:MAG: LLM class flavin-dependent oxidoreductase, partial [Actinobacteria bacterium]|nr:LLM class flavin-dependent oxidoreductase [Actinomycetota bacterium]
VKLGAQFLPEGFRTYLESVRKAEEVGYERAWLVDGQMLWQDVYVYLTHGLAATERIAMGPAVTNPLTRHFTVTASAIATLADLHPGRVLLGIGRGDNAVRTLGLDPVPTRQLAEIVPKLRELVAGRPVDFQGTEVKIRWADEQVPVMMPATGPRNLRLAGALADIAMIYVGIHEASVRWAIEHVRAGAVDADRDPDSVEIALLTAMWVGEEQEEAWAKCRWAPAACANHVADTMRRNAEHGMPEPMTRLVQARDEYDYYAGHLDSTAEHTSYLTGELVDDFTITGPPERCLATLGRLAELGVSEVSCAYLNGEVEQMARVGREIIPALCGPVT